jgi:IclR family mhp operon transcriptional activator
MRRAVATETSQYKEVRGLVRGLAVLRALNGLAGGIGSVLDVARATGIHRTTAKRLLETLKAEGLVDHRDGGGTYALTFEVRRLAEGYVGSGWIDSVAAPAMRAHLRSLSWPSDLATPDGVDMVVRESTHRQSMLSQHRATIGVRIPMLVSSLGRAWLAHCADEAREVTLAMLRARDDADGALARDTRRVDRLLAETRRRGYALNAGEWLSESDVTAIACPILDGAHAIAAVNLVFVRDVVALREIRARHVPLLRALARQISDGIAAAPAER